MLNCIYLSCRCRLFGRRKRITFLYTANVSAHAGGTLKTKQNKIKQTKHSKINNERNHRHYGFWISSTALLSRISETREKKTAKTYIQYLLVYSFQILLSRTLEDSHYWISHAHEKCTCKNESLNTYLLIP